MQKELHKESKEFVEIHTKVKEILREGIEIDKVFDFSNKETEGKLFIDKLEDINKDLAKCQKGLNDFIAKKRKVFQRFYFLTMEELLDILANGNNPLMLFKVKNYMNKIVQAADKLEMEEQGENERPKILSMTSSVGIETVTFIKGGITLLGKVENYLQDVIEIIRETIKSKSRKFMANFKTMDRQEWIEKNFAQISLLINSIYWVNQTEEKLSLIQSGQANSMKEFLKIQVTNLTDLIKMVQGKLSKALRKKIMCLITIDTHNRDVVEKLINEGVRKPEEFHW